MQIVRLYPVALHQGFVRRLCRLVGPAFQRLFMAAPGCRNPPAVSCIGRGKLPGQMLGKSPWLQSVHMMTDAAIGDIVTVELLSAVPVSMAGAVRVKQAA